MKKIMIDNIPAILWGDEADKIYICVHGKMSCKEEAQDFAELATLKGYQVLCFDLPEHGERKDEDYPCNVWNGLNDLNIIMKYVNERWKNISLCATSLGAYFSLLAYKNVPLEKCLFLSPILDMERLILNMMKWNNISLEMLKEKREIATPTGETLYWDYYCFVQENHIVKWNVPTYILYGSEDNLTEYEIIKGFVDRYTCDLTVLQNGEHWFHTEEQLSFLNQWLNNVL